MAGTLSVNCTSDASWQDGAAGVAATCFIYKEAASDWEGLLCMCTAAFQIHAENNNVAELHAAQLALQLADRAMQHMRIHAYEVRHLEVLTDSQYAVPRLENSQPHLHGIPVEYKWNPRGDSSISVVNSIARQYVWAIGNKAGASTASLMHLASGLPAWTRHEYLHRQYRN